MNDLINLLKDEWVISSINDRSIIPPAHITIIPTSKTSSESEGVDIDFRKLCKIIDIYKKLGTRAVTISGKSPSSYNRISDVIEYLVNLNIDVGLIDNGESIEKISPRMLNKLKWIKLVHTDCRSFNGRYENLLKNVVSRAKNIDWSFIYEVTEIPNFYGIVRTINFAKENGFLSVNIVLPDRNIEKVSVPISSFVSNPNKIVIYEIKQSESLSQNCYVSFLKPVIREDGKIYPCMDKNKSSIYSSDHIENNFLKSSKIRCGCSLCGLSNYNELLKMMMQESKHPNFV